MIIYIKMDLALNNLQGLICHKTQPNEYYHKVDLEEIVTPYTP